MPCCQWPFQEPRLEVPTIYKAFFLGLNFREYPHNSYGQWPMVRTNVPPWIKDPEDLPLIHALLLYQILPSYIRYNEPHIFPLIHALLLFHPHIGENAGNHLDPRSHQWSPGQT